MIGPAACGSGRRGQVFITMEDSTVSGNLPQDGGRWVRFVVAATILVGVVGCGTSGPDTQAVQGTVTIDGAPLEGATVYFSPTGSGGAPAAGQTGSGGVFRLTTVVAGARGGGGAVAGDYAVVIQKREMPAVAELSTDDPRYGGDRPSTESSKAIKELVPVVYGDAKTSPLQATVKKGVNAFTFEIESKGK
jgi:hypothetical protein